ncbi:MAG TPA: helix-turn-helix domain-containing protein [Candidatus Paceibacterota bacterium]|nr:helix-turn-helix domain-containing protein [Candidatus Paceibacterota bacterium]
MPNSYSIEQAAKMLGVSRRTVYNRINYGLLETVRVDGGSRSQRVTSESLQREIRCRRVKRKSGSQES